MGRPSKLTPTQWEELGRRLAGGDLAADLAREFDISQTSISKRFSQFPKAKIGKVARELAELPPHAQQAAVTLADELRAISGHLAAGARYGSATAHRLQALAHGEVQKLADASPLAEGGFETLKGVNALTRSANDAAAMGLSLLNANREQGKQPSQPIPLALNGSDIDG